MRIARIFNEIATVLAQEQYGTTTKLRLLSSFYSLLIRQKLSSGKGDSFHFLGYTIQSSSFTNVVTIVKEVFLFGDYYFKPSTTTPFIIDCGSNIGTTTLFYKWMFPKAEILALEPSFNNAEYLRKNVNSNGITDGITIMEVAAGNSEGEIDFWENEAKPGGSTAIKGVYESKPKNAFVKKKVKLIKLSNFIKKPVDLLKLDVEGSEGLIFRDLASSGKLREIKNIIFEYHQNVKNKDNNLIEILTTLESNGFEYVLFSSEFGVSSERLISLPARHFLVRAKNTAF